MKTTLILQIMKRIREDVTPRVKIFLRTLKETGTLTSRFCES